MADDYLHPMAGFDISYFAAAGGGLISFLSPCVLPLVPAYLCFLGGTSLEQLSDADKVTPAETRRAVVRAVVFVFGFSTVFVLLGASATAINHLILEHLDILGKIAGAIIVLFGLHFIGVLRIPLLNREVRFHGTGRPTDAAGAYVMGVAFGFGWTPCIGPILATILAIAASEESITFGTSLLSVYALGLGIPFVLAALAFRPFLRFMRNFRRHLRKVEMAMGGMLVATGLLIATNSLQVMSYWMLETFPFLATIG